jgi:hypothetical protein
LPADAELMLADRPVLTELGFSSARYAGYDGSELVCSCQCSAGRGRDLVTGVWLLPEPEPAFASSVSTERTYSSTEGGYLLGTAEVEKRESAMSSSIQASERWQTILRSTVHDGWENMMSLARLRSTNNSLRCRIAYADEQHHV